MIIILHVLVLDEILPENRKRYLKRYLNIKFYTKVKKKKK